MQSSGVCGKETGKEQTAGGTEAGHANEFGSLEHTRPVHSRSHGFAG